MAEELEGHARMRGARVAWGRCHEERRLPPIGPGCGAYGRSFGIPTRRRSGRRSGSGAPEIAAIVAEVRTYLPDIPPPLKVDSPQYARFRLF